MWQNLKILQRILETQRERIRWHEGSPTIHPVSFGYRGGDLKQTDFYPIFHPIICSIRFRRAKVDFWRIFYGFEQLKGGRGLPPPDSIRTSRSRQIWSKLYFFLLFFFTPAFGQIRVGAPSIQIHWYLRKFQDVWTAKQLTQPQKMYKLFLKDTRKVQLTSK